MNKMTVAEVAYDKKPVFERYAPRQMSTFEGILNALETVESTKIAASETSTPIGVAPRVVHPTP